MSRTELQTIVLDSLKRMEDQSEQRHNALRRALDSLTARQSESEKQLRHLSELYASLKPLIETINNAVRNAP